MMKKYSGEINAIKLNIGLRTPRFNTMVRDNIHRVSYID